MKIERVDDKTVKCFLSNEELAEYEIDYKDFILRSEKAREVMREIIEQAQAEVGYRPPRFAFDLQIMLVPEHGMVLTFSDRDPVESGAFLIQKLQELKQFLLGQHLALAQANGQGVPGEQADAPGRQSGGTGKKKEPEALKPGIGIFSFARIGDVMEFATALPQNLRIRSALYRTGETYYLVLEKGSASYERFSRACIQAMEFGYIYGAGEDQLLHLSEHGECLIAEKAVKKLRIG